MRPFVLAAVLVLAGCNSNGGSVPAQPAYDVDVSPILMAHCARCHGAGGTLNVPTEPTGPNAPILSSIQGAPVDAFKVLHCYLDRYDDGGDCTAGDGGAVPDSCQRGAAYWANTGLLRSTVHATSGAQQMPPPPAVQLDDWALQIIDAWVAEKPNFVCSHSPNPDTTICPNGP